MKRTRLISTACTMAAFLCNCLPGDIRPPPGRVYLAAEPSSQTLETIQTADGWNIELDRFLVGIGGGELEGTACNQYANARYNRLFDFLVPETQKICELYALGDCFLEASLRAPGTNTILQEGVTHNDLELMLEANVDIPVPIEVLQMGGFGTTVFLQGQATRAAETKRFAWKFPTRLLLGDCRSSPLETDYTSEAILEGGEDLTWVLVFHAEELFRELPEDDAPLRFDSLANADTNADGDISVAELIDVPSPLADMMNGTEIDIDDMDGFGSNTLAGYLSQTAMARIVFLDGKRCEDVRGRR